MNEILRSKIPLGECFPNLGSMFRQNCEEFGDYPAFAERVKGSYAFYSWNLLGINLSECQKFLFGLGLQKEDRVTIVSQNSYTRLVAEMSVMCSGMVSVPIFVGYNPEFLNQLISVSDSKLLIIEDAAFLNRLRDTDLPTRILILNRTDDQPMVEGKEIYYLDDILGEEGERSFYEGMFEESVYEVKPDDLMLIMYTSGTTSFPKGVMLTHKNILSQQSALKQLWKPESQMRFLCYLPWHHSFGGLFERFFALSTGGCLAVDDSRGKDTNQLFANFKEIQPNIYFSVPKVYQEIVSRTLSNQEADQTFFHPDLKFIFTAAAPLTSSITDVFKKKKVPVVEGWGLTETSPCCTLTELSLDRDPGIVGFPIPGVEIKLGEENEILVKGPNVMKGYFRQEIATKKAFDDDGWFKTGDLGEFGPKGVRIVSRKDRMFKLSNGEKVFPSVLEERAKTNCIYIKNIYIFGKGQPQPLALIFPNYGLLSASILNLDKEVYCDYPKDIQGFGQCLARCFFNFNEKLKRKYERIQKAILIDEELSLDKGELTPSLKVVPRIVEKNFKEFIDALMTGETQNIPENGRFVSFDEWAEESTFEQ